MYIFNFLLSDFLLLLRKSHILRRKNTSAIDFLGEEEGIMDKYFKKTRNSSHIVYEHKLYHEIIGERIRTNYWQP